MANFLAFKISGTTFSGHPTLTTLGNTLRSILYMCYYLSTNHIHFAWRSEVMKTHRFFFAVAGDDVVFWAPRDLIERLYHAILRLTARTPEGFVGLG